MTVDAPSTASSPASSPASSSAPSPASASRARLVNPNPATLVLVVSALAVVLNVLGGTLVGLLSIPFLFLDTIGTFFIAAVFGIRWGILVGVVTNLVLGVTSGPTSIPFAIVQVAIAVIVGAIANRWGYTWKTAPVAGVLVAIVAPLIGTAIAVALFGGLTGNGLDVVVLWLEQAGTDVFGAAFWPRLGANAVDKIATALLVVVLVRAIPRSLVAPRRREGAKETTPAAA